MSPAAIADNSPRLGTEARQLAARRAAQERSADAQLNTLNARVMDIIKLGQEALKSKIDVEDGWLDEE